MGAPVNMQAPLRLVGGLVQAQRLAVPASVIARLPTYRHACRLAWKLRRPRNMTQRTLAELSGAYASHVSDYFSIHASRRELPARWIPLVEAVLGNSVISQWMDAQCELSLDELLERAA